MPVRHRFHHSSSRIYSVSPPRLPTPTTGPSLVQSKDAVRRASSAPSRLSTTPNSKLNSRGCLSWRSLVNPNIHTLSRLSTASLDPAWARCCACQQPPMSRSVTPFQFGIALPERHWVRNTTLKAASRPRSFHPVKSSHCFCHYSYCNLPP